MIPREIPDAVEVLQDRLYWVTMQGVPKSTPKIHYFSIDNRLVYEPFLADFGPLNLAMTFRYCKMMEATLKDQSLADKRIVHCCSHDPGKRANAAFLICAYQVIALRTPADVAYEPFSSVSPHFTPFRDATRGVCTYQCTVLDCLKGLEYSIKLGWFDWNKFDVESYEFYQEVENGDMNWIIPDKFLAFAGPCSTSTDADGFPAFTPEDYVGIFKSAAIELVVRLNTVQYDRRRFIDNGVKHVDLYFRDGSCPPADIIQKFLHIVEAEPNAIAVHCKAGLGRTGTLIGMYAMKHFQFPAREFTGWNRICRPGSILGPQQQFMCDMQADMFQAGAMLRRPAASLVSQQERTLAQQMEKLNIRDPAYEDVQNGVLQGDHLTGAKRQFRVGEGAATAAVPNARPGGRATAGGAQPSATGAQPQSQNGRPVLGGTYGHGQRAPPR